MRLKSITTTCLPALVSLVSLPILASPFLPPWQSLTFEQHALWATATSALSIAPVDGEMAQWQLMANSSVVSNSEEVNVVFQAGTGATINRSRLSRGKNQRLKTYTYQPDHVLRERRNPQKGADTTGSHWKLKSRKQLDYPRELGRRPVIDAYTLLPLANHFLQSGQASMEFAVHTDLNFYRVTLSHGGTAEIAVNYLLTGGDQVTGKRRGQRVHLHVEPLGPLEDKPDFSLLGLNDDIRMLFDAETGLPLQLRGLAPHIGNTSIELKSATLREKRE